MKTKGIKATGSLLKRVVTRNMFPLEVDSLRRLIAYMKQFHRLKFGEATPQEYLEITQSVESLIPSEIRLESYVGFELSLRPTYGYVGDVITDSLARAVRYTTSSTVRAELTRILESQMYEPPDLSDVSSSDSSPPQEVPDNDEPNSKKQKMETGESNSTQSNQMQSSQFQATVQSQQSHQQPKTVIVSQPNLVQKIVNTPPTMAVSINSSTSTQSDSNALNSQIIQIHQVNQQPGKMQRVSAANLTPQQQQNILQSIKQQQLRIQQSGSPQQQSLIIKQQQVLQQIQKQQPTLIQQPVSSPKPGTSLLTSNSTNQVPTIIASLNYDFSFNFFSVITG